MLSVWDGLLGVDLPGLLGASVGVTVSVFGLDAAKAVVARWQLRVRWQEGRQQVFSFSLAFTSFPQEFHVAYINSVRSFPD